MARVLCKLLNASSEINGVKFEDAPNGRLSEEIPADVAQGFLEIPGYELAIVQKDLLDLADNATDDVTVVVESSDQSGDLVVTDASGEQNPVQSDAVVNDEQNPVINDAAVTDEQNPVVTDPVPPSTKKSKK